MANSGKSEVYVTGNHTLYFEWWQQSQSIANNSTTIGWRMWVEADAYGAFSYGGSHDWSVTVNGTTYSGTANWSVSKNGSTDLASGSTTIGHNSDGSKTFSYSFSQTFGFTWGGKYRGTFSGSGTGTLNRIARVCTLTAGNGTLGVQQTLTVNGTSGLTYKITYTCGNASGTITSGTSSMSINWTPPMSLASQNTTGTAMTAKLTLTTLSGSTVIGTNEASIKLTIPASVAPTVSFTVADETGVAATYGYLKSLSQLRIKVTASGASGSTIRQNTATVDGKTYTGNDILTNVLTKAGQLTVTVKTTDTRGRTATATKTITVLEYELPKVAGLNIYRSDASGAATSAGEYLTVVFSAEIYPLGNKNTATYKIQQKKTTDAGYAETTLTNLAGQYSVNNAKFVFAADKATSYDIVVIAIDVFKTVKKAGTGSAVGKLWSVLAKGLGFAFGKVAKLQGVLDIAFTTRMEGGLLYPVLSDATDLNDVTTPNWYTGADAAGAGYGNCPVTTGTFMLEVSSVGNDGELRQKVILCSLTAPKTVERFYSGGSWGAWLYCEAGETVLYDDAIGSNGTITLAESLDAFRYVDVYFTDNNGKTGGFSRTYNPSEKKICLAIVESSGGAYLRHSIYSASGNTLTPDTGKSGYLYLQNATPTKYNGNYIKIVRVIGHA